MRMGIGLWVIASADADPIDVADIAAEVEDLTGLFARVYGADDPEFAPIVGGEVVSDPRPNVVALAGYSPTTGETFVFCSGSQISEEWILTAAHCVLAVYSVAPLQPYVLYGGNVLGQGFTDAVPLAEWHANPAYDSYGFINDAGVARLAEPRPDVPWMVLNDAPVDATWIGTPVTYYGFGITSDGGSDSGIQRTTQIPITAVDPFNFTTFAPDTNVCQGDSGGPSTFDGPDGPEQVGVNAFVTPACVGGSGGSTRVDTQLAFIGSHVPDFATDYSQLPQEEVEDAVGPTRHWLDFGLDDGVPGFDVLGDGVSSSGCSTAPGFSAAALLLAAVATRRRVSPRGR
jgi:secreted trypsin-like serine protease